MYRGKTTIFWSRKSHIFVVTSHAVCFPFRLRFPAAFCGVSASGFGRPPHLGDSTAVRYWPDPSRIIWNFGWFLIWSIYIWSPYGHICFVPNIPLGELANAKEENWLVWRVKKTWKRAHLFGHPRTMELSLSLEIREIPALQVDGTSSRTSGSKETKLWSLEIRHDVTRWPNWLMKNLYWKNIPATLSVTHQRLIICCMPLKSCRFY